MPSFPLCKTSNIRLNYGSRANLSMDNIPSNMDIMVQNKYLNILCEPKGHYEWFLRHTK